MFNTFRIVSIVEGAKIRNNFDVEARVIRTVPIGSHYTVYNWELGWYNVGGSCWVSAEEFERVNEDDNT